MRSARQGRVNRDPQPFFNEARGQWEVRVELPSDSGKRRRRVLRDPKRAEVIRMRNAVLREVDDNGNAPTRRLSVGEFAEAWLEAQREGDKRASTYTEYKSVTGRYIVPMLGRKRLAELQPGDVSKWLAVVSEMPKSSGTGAGVERVSVHVVKSARKVLSAMLSSAQHDGHVTRNVARLSLMPASARANAQRAALTVHEAKDVLRSLAHSDDSLWTLWAAAILSGMRAGELAGLRRSAVTESAVYVTHQLQRLPYMHGCGGRCGQKKPYLCPDARVREPKGAKVERLHGALCLVEAAKTEAGTRVIPNYGPLSAVLDARLQGSQSIHGLVWERDGKPIDPNDFSRLWGALEPSLNLSKHIVPHAMRNTTAGLMYAAHVPEITIQQVLGHTEAAMSRSYARHDLDVQGRELDALTRMLAGQ